MHLILSVFFWKSGKELYLRIIFYVYRIYLELEKGSESFIMPENTGIFHQAGHIDYGYGMGNCF